jgi:hypothetical protein
MVANVKEGKVENNTVEIDGKRVEAMSGDIVEGPMTYFLTPFLISLSLPIGRFWGMYYVQGHLL